MATPCLALFVALLGTAPAPLNAANVVRIALDANPDVARSRLELDAIAGKRALAEVWLPSLPNLQAQLGRSTPIGALAGGPGINWSVSLSQQLEVAGQRWVRLDAMDAAQAAQLRRIVVTERQVTATALSAYYQLVTAVQATTLAREVAGIAEATAALAQAKLQESLIAPVDADVALAESIRMRLGVVEAQRQLTVAQAQLQLLLGDQEDAAPAVVESMAPLALPNDMTLDPNMLVPQALRLRGELAASDAEKTVLKHQLELWQRERVPNVTLSVFASQDYSSERVIGGGVTLPIPLPSPVVNLHAGAIAETRARIGQADATIEQTRRQVRQEVVQALANDTLSRAALDAFDPTQVARVRADLQALGDAIRGGQLTMREALLAQRSLVDLLQAHIGVRLTFALARVELLRATGLPLSGVQP
jgi:cobalt-zinc-cadmium efflux system outer membrane protein